MKPAVPLLEKLLYLRGISADYFSYAGEHITHPLESRLKFLQATGYDINDQIQIEQAIHTLDAEPWTHCLAEFNIATQGDCYVEVRLHPDELNQTINWQVLTELDEHYQGSAIAADLADIGHYVIKGVRYSARRLDLPALALGYHQLQLSTEQRQATASLAISPARSYQPTNIDHKLWGVSCQLYTLRSLRNWGIGDFSDLKDLVGHCASQQMDIIGLNPLHAPPMSGSDFASPYSPSDRRFLNPLYIDPEQVTDFSESSQAQRQFDAADLQQQLANLRSADLVDYPAVALLKYSMLETLFDHFTSTQLHAESSRGKAFQSFVAVGGETLASFANYESQHCSLPLQAVSNPIFHQYLQWLAFEQLQHCQQYATEQGMAIGLMGDLAVGAIGEGAEVGCNPELFCHNASIGAPPDPFSEHGQDWALPALDPIALKQNNYQHFIALLRANMNYCGALRIDHVMALLRLWWCLADSKDGAYIYYPFEQLLALLKLESHRNQCLIIGEDMGVVPEILRQKMTETNILSNKVLYFERNYHAGDNNNPTFTRPQDHQCDALLMVTNHDVSTLAGWWQASDLMIQAEIGKIDNQQTLDAALAQRQQDKALLRDWLQEQQLLPANWQAEQDPTLSKQFDLPLCQAIISAAARSQSTIMTFQLEDLQLIEKPVNIPGTYLEYPNWRRKQSVDTDSLFSNANIQSLLSTVYQERSQ